MTTLALDSDNNIIYSMHSMDMYTGVDALAQDIRTKLRMYKGECFLNPSLGIRYANPMQRYSTDLLRNVITEAIESDSRVAYCTVDINLAHDIIEVNSVVTPKEGEPIHV